MLITAIAKMSARSNAFRFVDFDPTQIDVQMLSELIGLRPGFVAPNYYIRGAITQLDSNVLSSNVSAGISAPSLDLAASRGQIISVMSVDLNIGHSSRGRSCLACRRATRLPLFAQATVAKSAALSARSDYRSTCNSIIPKAFTRRYAI